MTNTDLDKLLSTENLASLRQQTGRAVGGINAAQAQRLTAHAKSLTVEARPLNIGIVRTYTSDLLDPWFGLAGALQGLDVRTYHAPYGLALQEAHANSGLVRHAPAITLLMLRREDLHPDLARPIVGLPAEARALLRAQALARLKEVVCLFRAQKVGHLVLTLLPSLAEPALGLYDSQSDASEDAWWSELKSDIGQWLRQGVPSSLFLDLDADLQRIGRSGYFDRRFWYSARFPFSPEAARELTRRVVAIGTVLTSPRAKVLVLDADNTLWGGILGEDGVDAIALGPDYPGNAFVDFQRRILDFMQRGFILALCSKNNFADVDDVLREHPHQILRGEHFAARRVNWLPKTDNLLSLAAELNLGLDSFIFVDDSDHECAAVRLRLPQVEVVQTPARAVDIPTCLDQVARLEILSLTAEDSAKTELYSQERLRRDLSDDIGRGGGGVGEYLASLKMKMRVHLNAETHVSRLSQLTQKTNQFNLTTRRYDEHQIREFVRHPEWIVADFSLADVFGDSGIVGVALFEVLSPRQARLDNLLMSCRVIGRDAEAAFLNVLLRQLAERGIEDVVAEYLPTAKNDPVKSFLTDQQFDPTADGRFRRNLLVCPPRPEAAFPIAIDIAAEVAV